MKRKSRTEILGKFENLNKPVKGEDKNDSDAHLLKDTFDIVYSAVESSLGGIMITDLNDIISYINPALKKMFGYSEKSSIIGKNAKILFADDEIKTFSDVEVLINITKGDTEEFAVYRKDGTEFFVEVSYSEVFNSKGTITGKMASFINITKRKKMETEQQRLIETLQDAIKNVKTLRGLIPICASCKKVRDDEGYWQQAETYIQDHSEAMCSHGICPECAKKLYPEFYSKIPD